MYRSHDKHNDGFTLIELLIAIAIIGILSAVALPMYSNYVKRSKISEAVAGLSDMRTKMEQYFLDNRTYANACNPGTIATPPTGQHFDFSCDPAPDATTYTIVARGKDSDKMGDFQYSINQANTKSTISLPNDWVGAGNNCWVLKSDGSC